MAPAFCITSRLTLKKMSRFYSTPSSLSSWHWLELHSHIHQATPAVGKVAILVFVTAMFLQRCCKNWFLHAISGLAQLLHKSWALEYPLNMDSRRRDGQDVDLIPELMSHDHRILNHTRRELCGVLGMAFMVKSHVYWGSHTGSVLVSVC